MVFPHLYGPLPIAAVISVTSYRAGADGLFPPIVNRRRVGVGFDFHQQLRAQ